MTRLASRFGASNLIRRDRPLTREELFRVVPSVFSEDKHESRSERYTYIPTISLLESLQREGFQPFFACQTRVRDPGRREHTKHMLRLRREGQITGKQVPEIILLNSHDGTSSYQMLPGLFRAVCQNGLVCGESFGEVRVPHKGGVVSQVIEGAYEVLGIFDRVEEKRDAMQSLMLPPPAQQALAQAALTYRFGENHQPVTAPQIPLVVAATYTSPFIPLNANKFHESKHEKSTCYNFGGGEALSVARCSLANVTYSSA